MVKLSYYFPVSSDSVSLKKQLLESGVLDITNETMYRMAPEAVDPSILSRGSLSYRRYTRSALLMLRDDVLSKKNPKCLTDSRLLKFSFWKLNNKNFTITDESTTTAVETTGTTTITTTTTATSLKSTYEKNSLNMKYRSNNNNRYNFDGYRRQYSTNKYNGGGNVFYNDDNNNTQFRYDSREGRFFENSSDIKSYTPKDHYISSYNGKINDNNYQQRWNNYESRNTDHSNFRTSSYMMPSYFKQQKYDKSDNNNYDVKYYNNGEKDHYHHYRTEYKADKKSMGSEINDQNDLKNYNINEMDTHRNSFYKNSECNNEVTERYGSGRLSFNKHWNHNQFEKKSDFNSSDAFSKKHSDMYHNNNKNSGHYYYNNNYHNNNFNYHQYHSRHRKDSASSSAQSFNSEEPEWLSCGPTSQNDIIELRGFDDDLDNIEENDKDVKETATDKNALRNGYKDEKKTEDLNSKNANANAKKIEETISSDTNSTNIGNKLEIQVNGTSITSGVSGTSNCNDEIQSVCTSTAASPPPARSTPTKLLNMSSLSNNQKLPNQVDVKVNGNNNSTTNHNKKNYYSLQFNFDNFLDYDTINNILGNNSKSRSSHWFKNHHNGSHHNNDSKGKHNLSTIDKKNFKQPGAYPKNAINVKDLEDQMRQIDYQKYFSHSNTNNNYNNINNHYNRSNQFKNDQGPTTYQHHSTQFKNPEQTQSPIKDSVNAFTQSAYKQMLAQANLIVRQAQDPEVFRRFLEQINSMNQIAALSQLSKPLLLPQPLFTFNNGKAQKRIPSMRELECHTKNIVQNALFRKHLQEQQKLRIQELQQLTLQSNINPNAPEFTPTSVLRKMSAEKENFTSIPSSNIEMENKFFDENMLNGKNNKFSAFLNQQHFLQQQQKQQQQLHHQNSSELLQQNLNQKNSLIFNNFNRFINNNSDTSKKITEKHIKWDNDYLHYIPTNKPSTGRPILKGSNTNFPLKTQNSQYPSILKQQQQQPQQQNEENHYGFDHFLKTKNNFPNTNNQSSRFNESTQFTSSSTSTSMPAESNWFKHLKFNQQNQKEFHELESTNASTENQFLTHGKPTINLIRDESKLTEPVKENNNTNETGLQNIGNHSNSEISK